MSNLTVVRSLDLAVEIAHLILYSTRIMWL